MFKTLVWRFLGLIFVLALAVMLVLWDAHPALAQTKTVDYSFIDLLL